VTRPVGHVPSLLLRDIGEQASDIDAIAAAEAEPAAREVQDPADASKEHSPRSSINQIPAPDLHIDTSSLGDGKAAVTPAVSVSADGVEVGRPRPPLPEETGSSRMTVVMGSRSLAELFSSAQREADQFATMLATRGVVVDAQLDSLAISEVSRSTEQLKVKALDDPSRTHGMSLESSRVGLRAPGPDDADISHQVVNDPQVSWRLASRGSYVSPGQVFASCSQNTELMLVACERSSQEPITMLSLTAMSERNGVAEFSFYSLRNSSDPYSGESMEALVCLISHRFGSGVELLWLCGGLCVRNRERPS
jgi:hypothetical protein